MCGGARHRGPSRTGSEFILLCVLLRGRAVMLHPPLLPRRHKLSLLRPLACRSTVPVDLALPLRQNPYNPTRPQFMQGFLCSVPLDCRPAGAAEPIRPLRAAGIVRTVAALAAYYALPRCRCRVLMPFFIDRLERCGGSRFAFI
jgi:hypothetical protein